MSMKYETTYWFFNLLLCGLISSEIYFKIGRSQRQGMALGLIFLGLIWALTLKQSRETLKRDGFRLGAVIFLIISLTCTGELLWGETQFKIILMVTLITLGLLSDWSQGEIGKLPSTFWALLSVGAVIATFALGQGHVDLGAYLGAWIWVLVGHKSPF